MQKSHKRAGEMGDGALQIERIYGTSSNAQLNFAVSANLVAYIASGGVVLSHVNRETGQLSNQRFFCANNAQSQQTSAYSYLQMIPQSPQQEEKDSFGIPKLAQTVVVIDDTQQDHQGSTNSTPKNAQHKMKTIACIAISPDERFLAVGETGTQPRILIFSLAHDSNSFPLIAISEHNFGIKALHFSPDSKFLLSVGDTHDGFLFLWRLNGLGASIMGMNKCTSQINGVLWHEDSIITYGVRHIKVWKFEEFDKKSMIQGKNVILGGFINGNFVSATAVLDAQGEDDVLFLTSLGEICGYNYMKNALKLRYEHQGDENMGVLMSDSHAHNVWVATDEIFELAQTDLQQELIKDNDGNIDSPSKVKFVSPIPCLKQLGPNHLIYITANEEIKLFNIITRESKHLIDSLSRSVNGVKLTSSGRIVSWTKDGVLKWIEQTSFDLHDIISLNVPKIPNKVIENYITSLDISPQGDIITGDAYGNLTVYNAQGDVTFTEQAHEFTVNDVTFFQVGSFEFIVSIGRDRMIQVFAKTGDQAVEHEEIGTKWSIYQTLADHKGNLLQLIHHEGRIYVSSADRSITIHKFEVDAELVRIDKEKTISVKSSPSAITISNEVLLVSTMDKQLTIFNLNTLESIRSLKLSDEDNESLLVDNLIVTGINQVVCSCTDKSIRIFNYVTGRQLSVNWGHSEPIKFLVPSVDHLITLSSSGCLFSWSLLTNSGDQPSSIQKYNEFATPPKVARKIKKPVSQNNTPIRRPLNPSSSFTRSPVTTRLQSTVKMTPSKLTSTNTPTLSPSSPSGKMRTSPRSPVISRTSVLGNSKAVLENNGNQLLIQDLIIQLRSFRANMGSYTHQEVMSVKQEIGQVFEYEEELLQKMSRAVLNGMKDAV